MTAAELVGKLRDRGARFEVMFGALKVGSQPGVLTPELTKASKREEGRDPGAVE